MMQYLNWGVFINRNSGSYNNALSIQLLWLYQIKLLIFSYDNFS